MSQIETSNKEIMGLRKMLYAFKEVFKILDGLVEETRNVDEVVMGFLK